MTLRHMPRIDVERPASIHVANHQRPPDKTNWWRLTRNAANPGDPDDVPTGTLWIMDEIGYWGTTAADLIRELSALDVQRLDVHVNSPGGEVFDGLAIYNALLAHQAQVTIHIDGLAASIASVIAQAGDEIRIATAAQMMIHDASGGQWGTADDMRTMADILDRMSNQIAGVYAARAGGSVKDWRAAMLTETWYTGREAVTAGLATDVINTPAREPVTASAGTATFNTTRVTITVKPDDPPTVPDPPAPAPAVDEPGDLLDGAEVTAGLMAAFMPDPDEPDTWTIEPFDFRAILADLVTHAPVVEPSPAPPPTALNVRVTDLADALLEGLQL